MPRGSPMKTSTLVALVVALLAVSAAAFVALPVGFVLWFRSSVAERFTLPSNGMYPSYPAGVTVWVAKGVYDDVGDVERGDVVVFRHPGSDGRTYHFIWRAIGLPGEDVRVEGHEVWIDAEYLEQVDGEVVGDHRIATEGSWRVARPVDPAPVTRVDVVVPEGHLYLLGDNRYDASDSRTMGLIPFDAVIGRVSSRPAE